MFHAQMLRCVALTTLIFVVAFSAAFADGGGSVLSASTTPAGYSLEDMAQAMAYFDSSGNNLIYYPDIPFQILYVNNTNIFTVKRGTRFFVPVAFIDDSPPIFGDFPQDEEDIPDYVFGADQLGAHDMQIVVDGWATTIGAEYAAGAHAPGLLDGGGSNIIQIGAFLKPLSRGTHTVTIRGTFDGAVILDLLGGPYSFENTYTVIVN